LVSGTRRPGRVGQQVACNPEEIVERHSGTARSFSLSIAVLRRNNSVASQYLSGACTLCSLLTQTKIRRSNDTFSAGLFRETFGDPEAPSKKKSLVRRFLRALHFKHIAQRTKSLESAPSFWKVGSVEDHAHTLADCLSDIVLACFDLGMILLTRSIFLYDYRVG
jgi:hypothetical protein